MHALLGENGAGKSTLMNVLYGLYHPDEGEILINGEPVQMSPQEAIARGIGMVHQHFMLIPVMTVAENIVLAESRGGTASCSTTTRPGRACAISPSFGFAIDPDARIEDITVGQQQRVEILKALYRRADILILDEPTAVLTPQEAVELFGILRTLQREGMSIIFISHKLNEVLEIADRITVLRRGKIVETLPAAGATEEGLARLMVGREVLLRVEKGERRARRAAPPVEDVHVRDDRGLEKVRGVSLDGHAGEIVGIAGVDGNGQTSSSTPSPGCARPRRAGPARSRASTSREAARRHFDIGVGHIPEDRQRRGLVLDFSIAENIALHDFRKPPDSRFGWLFPAGSSSAHGD